MEPFQSSVRREGGGDTAGTKAHQLAWRTAAVTFGVATFSLILAEILNAWLHVGVAPHRVLIEVLLRDGQLIATMFGTFVVAIATAIYRHSHRWKRELVAFLPAAIFLELAVQWVRKVHGKGQIDFNYTPASWGTGLGIVALIYLGLEVVRSREALRWQAWTQLLLALQTPVFMVASTFAHVVIVTSTPRAYDLHGYLAEQAFPVPLSFFVIKHLRALPLLSSMVDFNYYLLAPMLSLLAFLWAENPAAFRFNFAAAKVIAGFGTMAYVLLPMIGTDITFGDRFPNNPPHYYSFVHPPPFAFLAPDFYARSCMPSLHMTWAVLIYWAPLNRRSRLGKMLALFALITVLSTMDYGNHYFIDLVVAMPFALSCRCLTGSPDRVALLTAAAALSLMLVWMLGLRYFPLLCLSHPHLCAISQLLTIGTVFWTEAFISRSQLRLKS